MDAESDYSGYDHHGDEHSPVVRSGFNPVEEFVGEAHDDEKARDDGDCRGDDGI